MSERVLVLSSTFPQYEDDPRGVFIRQHWEARAAAGQHVRVLAPATRWCRDDLDTPLEVRRFAYAPRTLSQLTGRFGILENIRERAWRAMLMPAYAVGSALALRRELEAFEPDRVVAHMFLPGGWTVASACARRGIPFEVYGHGTDVDLALRLPAPLRGRLLRRLLEARAVHLPSNEKLERVRGAVGSGVLPAHFRVETMSHATPRPSVLASRPPTGPGRVLFMGRLIEQKGVDDLLTALGQLDGVPVDIAGDGPERARLERLAAQQGIDATFHGYVSGEHKWSLFADATVLCVPSRERRGLSEGAPLVIEEARAMGLPVVAARTGGIPELCRAHGDAQLVPADDPDALATALASVLARKPAGSLRATG